MLQQSYTEFLKSKEFNINSIGHDIDDSSINQKLFPFQRDIVRWAVKKGRCAVFLDTGLGKTFIQLEWARINGKKTLIFAPLSVARQTILKDGKSRIELVDDFGCHIDTIEVEAIHVEINRDNVEPLNRQFNKPQMLKSGRFYAN